MYYVHPRSHYCIVGLWTVIMCVRSFDNYTRTRGDSANSVIFRNSVQSMANASKTCFLLISCQLHAFHTFRYFRQILSWFLQLNTCKSWIFRRFNKSRTNVCSAVFSTILTNYAADPRNAFGNTFPVDREEIPSKSPKNNFYNWLHTIQIILHKSWIFRPKQRGSSGLDACVKHVRPVASSRQNGIFNKVMHLTCGCSQIVTNPAFYHLVL